jgi:hypothetical protein
MSNLIKELEATVNRYSVESESDTPDFLLATYLSECLKTWAKVVKARDDWYGFKPNEALFQGNDLITEDSTPTRSDLESPLSAPTNTDELEQLAKFYSTMLPVGMTPVFRKEIARLIALKQREVLNRVRILQVGGHQPEITVWSDSKQLKFVDYIAELNTIIGSDHES